MYEICSLVPSNWQSCCFAMDSTHSMFLCISSQSAAHRTDLVIITRFCRRVTQCSIYAIYLDDQCLQTWSLSDSNHSAGLGGLYEYVEQLNRSAVYCIHVSDITVLSWKVTRSQKAKHRPLDLNDDQIEGQLVLEQSQQKAMSRTFQYTRYRRATNDFAELQKRKQDCWSAGVRERDTEGNSYNIKYSIDERECI